MLRNTSHHTTKPDATLMTAEPEPSLVKEIAMLVQVGMAASKATIAAIMKITNERVVNRSPR